MTVFLRALEAEDKAAAVLSAIRDPAAAAGKGRFEVDPASFAAVPRSPFAYWVGERLRLQFKQLVAFQDSHTAIRGAYTTDDFRFYRLGWELEPAEFARTRDETKANRSAVNLAKGGVYSPYYYDVHLAVRWGRGGAEAKAFLSAYRERKGWGADWSACLNGHSEYFRPGLTWPRRTQGGLSLRALPAGCIFADKGPAAFVEADDPEMLLALLAVMNSRPFQALVELQMAFGSYEVGVLQRTPVPDLSDPQRTPLSALARCAWSLKRNMDAVNETSHAFTLPALLQAEGVTLSGCVAAWTLKMRATNTELSTLQAEIDETCFGLYGLAEADRRAIREGFGSGDDVSSEEPGTDAEDDAEEPDGEADAAGLTAEMVSWAVGSALGRFDVRLATGERQSPVEPEPFDPLPVCSPGMLTGNDSLPLAEPPPGYPVPFPADGVLVDDPGHPRDLTAAVRHVFHRVFGANADSWWHDVAELLDPKDRDLGRWLGQNFFEHHLKRYSKSRRKAPILWQLATSSGRYSVWLYAHRLTRDRFFQVQNDFVTPKLQHEEQKLVDLQREGGPNPSSGQRRAIDEQESFVEELRAFRQEVARVAPLWNPDPNDGVIINFAPLWRLVPQHRQWQRECKECWDKLVAGDYDWADLAMHLWPERVVPKCVGDRSLAIAHGLEDEFWCEDEHGKWRKKEVSAARVEELVRERTSSAVKTALNDLLTAPALVGSSGRGRSSRTSAPPRAKAQRAVPAVTEPSPRPATPRASTVYVDDATLDAVKQAIARVAGGASKADVLAATGLSEGDWNRAVAALLDGGEVSRTGEKRGTRYHVATPVGPSERPN